MNSIYESFRQSAQIVPHNVCAKLLMRHSIRYEAQDAQSVSFHCPLTREGKELALFFGRGFRYSNFIPRYIYASPSIRCVQTAEYLCNGYDEKKPVISKSKTLKAIWISNANKWDNSFKSANEDILGILQAMLDNKYVAGAYNIRMSIKRLIQKLGLMDIESTKSTNKIPLDIFITHDAIIMLLLGFVLNASISELYKDYVKMCEGIFLWREKSEFVSLAWRGKLYRLKIKHLH